MRSTISPIVAAPAILALALLGLVLFRRRHEGMKQSGGSSVSITGEKDWAATYEGTGPGPVESQFAAAVVSQHAPKQARVCVVEAGTGASAAAMERLGHKVVAYESSPALVAVANAADPGRILGAEKPADAIAKSRDGQLGAVVASDPRIYAADHGAIAAAAKDKLKPGGILLVSVLDPTRLQKSYKGTLTPGTTYSATLSPVEGEEDAHLYVEKASGKKTFLRKTRANIPPVARIARAVSDKGYVLKTTYDLGKVGGDPGHNLCVFERK